MKKFILNLTNIFQAIQLQDTWKNITPCDILLVRSDLHCGYIYQGKAYSPLIDSIADLCENSGLVTRTVAAPYSKLIGTLAYNTPVSYNRFALLISLFRKIAWLILGRIKGEDRTNKLRAYFWGRVLEKTKPHCVIGIQPDVGLCRAGKMKGVPIYDLQHGVIDKGHPKYTPGLSFPKHLPLLRNDYHAEIPIRDLPNGYLCWNEQSAALLRKWATLKGIDVQIVGHVWFLRFLYPKKTDFLVQEAVNTGKIFKDNRPSILVTLAYDQDLFYQYDGFNGVMVDVLEKTILETAETYNWLLKLHPLQIRGSANKTTQSYLKHTFGHLASVDWLVCSNMSLPVLLQQVDLHITDMSSVVIEASWMKIYSALLNKEFLPGGIYEHYFKYEKDLGMVVVLQQDTKKIKQWITDSLIKDKRQSTLKDTRKELHGFIQEIMDRVRIESDDSRTNKGS